MSNVHAIDTQTRSSVRRRKHLVQLREPAPDGKIRIPQVAAFADQPEPLVRPHAVSVVPQHPRNERRHANAVSRQRSDRALYKLLVRPAVPTLCSESNQINSHPAH